jgi:hypothetical protein
MKKTLIIEKRKKAKELRARGWSKDDVSSSKEIEEAIKNGRIAEHPNWEDLIVIENLEE